jgi:hypothetical protein
MFFEEKLDGEPLPRSAKSCQGWSGFIGHRDSGAKRPLQDFRVWLLLLVLSVVVAAVF